MANPVGPDKEFLKLGLGTRYFGIDFETLEPISPRPRRYGSERDDLDLDILKRKKPKIEEAQVITTPPRKLEKAELDKINAQLRKEFQFFGQDILRKAGLLPGESAEESEQSEQEPGSLSIFQETFKTFKTFK
ncbi:hypothetical protein RYX36_033019 [Vicia faba]